MYGKMVYVRSANTFASIVEAKQLAPNWQSVNIVISHTEIIIRRIIREKKSG